MVKRKNISSVKHIFSKITPLLLALFILIKSAFSSSLLESLYINPINKKKPEAIIFYNTLNPCLTCNQTINLIINILRSNYKERLHAYLINLKYHPEFYPVFNLKGPLNLVIIPINDGTSFGYKKLSNPQSAIYDPISFKNQITEFIDNSIY